MLYNSVIAHSSPRGYGFSNVRASILRENSKTIIDPWEKARFAPKEKTADGVAMFLFFLNAQEDMNHMTHVKHALIKNLEKKGVTQGMIPGFLQSLSNYFSADPHMDLLQINHKLQTIGWDEIELDYHTFELARTWIENEGLDKRRQVQSS